MEYSISTYFLVFMIYSIAGWICEVVLQLVQKHKLSDRGFLIGPYCPIYGCGAILITLMLGGYSEHPIGIFILTMVLCGTLEYATSFIMEKAFHARWWDYSDMRFNINGRVCMETLLPFGIAGVLVTYLFNPFIFSIITKLSAVTINIIAIVSAVIFMADLIISSRIIYNFKKTNKEFISEGTKDNSDEISEKVKETLRGKSFLNRRLIDAFPQLTSILKEKSEQIKRKTEEVKDEITARANEVQGKFNEKTNEAQRKINYKVAKVKKVIRDGNKNKQGRTFGDGDEKAKIKLLGTETKKRKLNFWGRRRKSENKIDRANKDNKK